MSAGLSLHVSIGEKLVEREKLMQEGGAGNLLEWCPSGGPRAWNRMHRGGAGFKSIQCSAVVPERKARCMSVASGRLVYMVEVCGKSFTPFSRWNRREGHSLRVERGEGGAGEQWTKLYLEAVQACLRVINKPVCLTDRPARRLIADEKMSVSLSPLLIWRCSGGSSWYY